MTADTTPQLGFFYVDFSANAPVDIFRDGVLVAQTTTGSDGIGYYTSPDLVDGTYSFTARDPRSAEPSNLAPATVTIDTVAPTVSYAAYNGSQIILTFNEDLDQRELFDQSPFTVTIDGQPIYNEITVRGNEIIIGLQSPPEGEIVVTYTDPSAGDDDVAVQDRAGNDLASLMLTDVIDVRDDTTLPVLEGLSIVGDLLTLDYDSFLRQQGRADVGSFVVEVDGERILLRTVQVSGDTVVLRLARPVVEGESVTVAYTPGDSFTQDQNGNPAASFVSTAVVNNTDSTPPTVVVDIVDTRLTSSDRVSEVTFTFSELVVGFGLEDVTAIGGTISNLLQDKNDSLIWRATLTADDNFNGEGSVSVGTDFADSAGNDGIGDRDTVIIDLPFTPPVGPTNGADNLVGTSGPDRISLLAGNDRYSGLEGNDTIFGNQGDDILFGNQGNDLIFGGQDNDQVFGGQGNDELFGNRGADIVYGNRGDDRIFGNEDNDQLFGNEGADFLHGGQGNDSLYGGQDNDVLNGGAGDDILFGGLGSDTFVFTPGQGNDTIGDFSRAQGDVLDLQGQTVSSVTANGNGDAILALSGGGTITLTGATADEFALAA